MMRQGQSWIDSIKECIISTLLHDAEDKMMRTLINGASIMTSLRPMTELWV